MVFTVPKIIRPLFRYYRGLLGDLCLRAVTAIAKYMYGKADADDVEMDYLDFIVRITAHVPDKGQVMIRYYGLYSNAHRGMIPSLVRLAGPR